MTNKSAEAIEVAIFGKKYFIRGDAAPDDVKKIADFVHTQMDEVARKTNDGSPQNVAILAALNIAHKYFQMKEELESFRRKVAQKTKNIVELIDVRL